MTDKAKDKKPQGFSAFSTMKMPSLWDASKIKEAHKKNLKTLKESHGIVSETLKKVSDMHATHMKKQHADAKVEVNGISEKLKSELSVKEQVNRFKAHQAELAEKLKVSHEHVLSSLKEKISALKEHHTKLHEKLQSSKQVHSEKFKEKMKVNLEHHSVVANAWKDSTQKIMDLMKKTADHHLQSN
jgi:Flp pilus assembly secretin CpaC